MHAVAPAIESDSLADIRSDCAGPAAFGCSPAVSPRASIQSARTSRRALTALACASPRGSVSRGRNSRKSDRDAAGLFGQAIFQDLLKRRLDDLERVVLADFRRCLSNNVGALTQAAMLPTTGSSGALPAPTLPTTGISIPASPRRPSPSSRRTSTICQTEQSERRSAITLTVPTQKTLEKAPKDADPNESDPVLDDGVRSCHSDGFGIDRFARRSSSESVVSGLGQLTVSPDEYQHSTASMLPAEVIGGSARPSIHSSRTQSLHDVLCRGMCTDLSNLKLQPFFMPLPIWRYAMLEEDVDQLGTPNRSQLGISRTASMFSLEMLKGDSAKEPYQLNQFGPNNSQSFGLKRLMIHPGSQLNLCKEALKIFCLIFDFFFIPLQVFDLPDSVFTMAVSWLIRGFWTMDIPLSFLTGYFKEQGTAEMIPKAVAKHYARTWLFFDLSCLFFDWLDALAGGIFSFRAATLGDVARCLRLARLSKAWHSSFVIQQNIRSEQVILLGVIICSIAGMLGMSHFAACTWYMIARYQSEETMTWLKYSEFEDLPRGVLYTISLNWSLAQFTGEHIMKPANNTERSFGLVVYFLFFLVATIFVSTITTSMTRLQIISSKQSSQFAQLRRFLLDRGISRHLSMKVLRNAQHAACEQKHNAPESSVELLEIISTPLRAELHFEVHSRVVCSHPFFDAFSDENPPAARKFCHTAVSTLTLSIGDNLFNECETPVRPRMFFIDTGNLGYHTRAERSLRLPSDSPPRHSSVMMKKTTSTASMRSSGKSSVMRGSKVGQSICGTPGRVEVGPGQSACEAVLWTNWTHCGTMKALTECGITELDAKLFQEACHTFPSMHPGLYALKFVEYLNELADRDRSSLSDLPPGDYQISRMLECAFPQWDVKDEAEDVDDNMTGWNLMRRSSTGMRRSSSAPDRRSSRAYSMVSSKRPGRSSRGSISFGGGTPSAGKRLSLDGLRSPCRFMAGRLSLGNSDRSRNSEAVVLPEPTGKIPEEDPNQQNEFMEQLAAQLEQNKQEINEEPSTAPEPEEAGNDS